MKSYFSATMRPAEILENLNPLLCPEANPEEFIYDFLLAYGTPQPSIARLRSGQMNLAKAGGELILKQKK